MWDARLNVTFDGIMEGVTGKKGVRVGKRSGLGPKQHAK
jgi:hypothetical protein|eukprot:CAMPEP_0181206594 /NCGR_PEP_ID=MMETSP1096-20121128/21117_1 /TAXON_ID=156174 ORGANISM="Chrysochromulina ericina, Strain CCMP281" /NCGR_SAMPLE_ID=MMETSP1096 /ASSEMBLY_ACC=CAM_ASM_000453 /LENGTH=38 /DNA_ID= /DNA_START= /DNA_END= /DNA_ORIENTATION=